MHPLLFLKYMRKFHGYEKDSLIISSIPKSATHYVLFLVANYLRVHYTGASDPITPAMLYELFPNTLRNRPKPAPGQALAARAGFSDILWGHHYKYLRMSSAKKILFLFRNPLDQAVSSYHYSYVLRPETVAEERRGLSFSEALPHILKCYGKDYSYHKKNLLGRQALPLNYEVLTRDTRPTVYTLLHWLGLDVDVAHMDTAIALSSKDVIRSLEQKTGKTVASAKGSFIRSGRTGDWRTAFSEADLELARRILGEYGISLNEFILE